MLSLRSALALVLSAPPALILAAAPALTQDRPCDEPRAPLAPSRDLYCLELVPAPGVGAVSGRVELGHVPGPFTIAVAADGTPLYAPTMVLAGLPEPASFGDDSTYVAWVLPPVMHPATRLGEVRNGRVALPTIRLEKFVVLVTAEARVTADEPRGRAVLRGQSPSTRLQPPDLLDFAIGSMTGSAGSPSDPPSRAAEHADHRSETVPAGHQGALTWGGVPMPPGLTMLPAEMALRPAVSPYLPAKPSSRTIPAARPPETVSLSSGDTLRLEAGLVRRVLKGETVVMYGFNGRSPGPLIRVSQGAEITVELVNDLDQPTTVHWHGVRLENRFDGVPELTQDPVPPGGRFTYRVRFPDAGIYWYHPHVREDVQQDLGLYGNILVRSPDPESFSPANREAVLVLDDLLVGETGLVPFGREAPTHALMGRFGNVFLVNGEPSYALAVRRGEVVRFFLTNVSSTRTFNLSFSGARMKLVASDAGRFEREAWVESVVIAPAERYVVHVRFEEPGKVGVVNRVRGLDHLFGRFFTEADTLGSVEVSEEPVDRDLAASFRELATDDDAAREIERARARAGRTPDRSLVLALETRDLPFLTERLLQLDSLYFAPVEWSGTMPMMNWASTGDQVRWVLRDPVTGKENMDVDWRFAAGDLVRLRLSNERTSFHAMQHPIHVHGQRFLVLAVNGTPNENLVWKDTVTVPAGSTVDLLLELSNPGRWMLHCHIAEHISAGMMMGFTVGRDPGADADADPGLDRDADPELDRDADPGLDRDIDPELDRDIDPELDPGPSSAPTPTPTPS